MSPSVYEREQIADGGDVLTAIRHLAPYAGEFETQRGTLGVVRYTVEICGRTYTGRGETEEEAKWRLLASIANRQAEVCSCL